MGKSGKCLRIRGRGSGIRAFRTGSPARHPPPTASRLGRRRSRPGLPAETFIRSAKPTAFHRCPEVGAHCCAPPHDDSAHQMWPIGHKAGGWVGWQVGFGRLPRTKCHQLVTNAPAHQRSEYGSARYLARLPHPPTASRLGRQRSRPELPAEAPRARRARSHQSPRRKPC
jgi:hypothetical protein